MNVNRRGLGLEALLVVGAPLLLAIVELMHPRPHDLLSVDVRPWLVVHYAQLILFPLSALAVAAWARGQSGAAAAVCRASMFVFGATWTAWDAVAGVATGILTNAAHASGTTEAWRTAIDAIWLHPVMGGAGASLFAVAGAIALSVGALAAGIAAKHAGHSWGPVAVLVICSFGITIFRTHAWPGGPLTFGGIALAGAWMLLERPRAAEAMARAA